MTKQQGNQGGIRLRHLNQIMISITIVLGVVFILVAYSTIRSFNRLEQATEQYIRARKDTADMQAGSDYLTDRVRTFIVAGDVSSAKDFFREVEVTRRRELAMDSMEKSLSGTEAARYLNEALQASQQLAELERYAMRLAIEGNALAIDEFPPALREVHLSEADMALLPGEQLERARDLVFNETYQTFKKSIRDNISLCEQTLIGETEATQKRCSEDLEDALTIQIILILVVVLEVIFIVVYNAHLIIYPIEALVKAIDQDASAEESGAYELRFVSRAYNKALQESQQNQEQLAYRASHDALTGLYNRGAFEKAKQRNHGRAQAMFIIDVDRFKSFNDEYGHAIGDQVLQKVARTIQHHFREEDYVCRFGGDEFTVLMVHVNSAMQPMVESKLEAIRAALKDTSDGLPPITLSIGVAFSDRPDPSDDILKDADAALYVAKDRGKDGYAFYGEK